MYREKCKPLPPSYNDKGQLFIEVRLHVQFIIVHSKSTQQAKRGSCIDLYGILRRFNVFLMYLSPCSFNSRIWSIPGADELAMYALASNGLKQNSTSSVYSCDDLINVWLKES